jgi:hypothetical protein
MDDLSGEDNSLGPDLWTEQDPECKEYFPPREKSYFRSLRDVRPYDSKKPVKVVSETVFDRVKSVRREDLLLRWGEFGFS